MRHLSLYYPDGAPVLEGDSIVIDEEREAKVKGVFPPNSSAAEDYSCKKTGGILMLYDDGILILHPLGMDHEIRQRKNT